MQPAARHAAFQAPLSVPAALPAAPPGEEEASVLLHRPGTPPRAAQPPGVLGDLPAAAPVTLRAAAACVAAALLWPLRDGDEATARRARRLHFLEGSVERLTARLAQYGEPWAVAAAAAEEASAAAAGNNPGYKGSFAQWVVTILTMTDGYKREMAELRRAQSWDAWLAAPLDATPALFHGPDKEDR